MQQDNNTVAKLIDDMNLFDDDLMAMVFDNNIDATTLLLKIILKRDDITVISVVGQREFQNPVVDGRNIRLDIYAKDSAGKYYNIEVQRRSDGAHVRRARFHSSVMDSRMLKKGQDFSELPDSYMIFITQTDIFKHGLPIYNINRYFDETGAPFKDGSHIIYVNGSYKGSDAIGKLMHDFGCQKSKDIYYPEIAKGVKHFKEEGGRKIMCEAVEKYAQEIAAKAVAEERSALEERATAQQMLSQKIVAALADDKDNDTIIKELNCTLEQITPYRVAMKK